MTTGTMTLQSGNAQTGLLRRLFPGQIDNNFRGHRLALWLFGFYALVKLVQGAESVFNGYATAKHADGIPLDSYGAAVVQTMLSLFALLGLNLLVFPLLGAIALVRYRAMIPLLYLMMVLLSLGGRAVQLVLPVARLDGVQPIGFYVNLVLLAVLLLGFALSLARPARDAAA
jgi:hypothetical protein